MPRAINESELLQLIQKAADQCLKRHPDYQSLTTTVKLNYATQAAVEIKDLISPNGQVESEVISAVAAVAEGFRDDIIALSIKRAWAVYNVTRH